MSEHQSKLTFSIEESVWLNKGQEISSVLGLSLEPDIVIEERGDQVFIKGGLQLVGQYEGLEQQEENEESLIVEQQSSFRPLGNVRTNEDGIKELTHFLPVDITIPASRIRNLDEVYVQIESFDYDLPERTCIQLTADISISGMTAPDSTNETKSIEREKVDVHTTTFTFDAKKEEVPVEREQTEQIVSEEQQSNETEEVQVVTQFESEEISEDEKDEVELVEARVDDEEVEEEELVEEQEMVEERTIITMAGKSELQEEAEQSEEDEEDDEETSSTSSREDNALYLTKMMANEEEQFTTWKMCIIQENESLEMIADRYDVSLSQLVRFNRLDQERVEEGQILYIPISAKN